MSAASWEADGAKSGATVTKNNSMAQVMCKHRHNNVTMGTMCVESKLKLGGWGYLCFSCVSLLDLKRRGCYTFA